MNKDLLQVLQYFNLSQKEASVYLVALQLGEASAYEISKLVNLKQPTVYVTMDCLVQKGIVSCAIKKRATLYTPISPRDLIKLWKSRIEALDAFTPELNNYYAQGTPQPKVIVLEGEKGIDQAYNQFLPKDSKGEEMLLISNIKAVKSRANHLLPLWEKTVKNKRNRIREIVNFEPGIQAYIERLSSFGNPNYQVKATKKDLFGKCDTIIFQDKIALFSLEETLFVTIIQSKEIVKTYRSLFEMAWGN